MKARRRLWIFDLDNTLHNASAHIFPHINREMMRYIQRALELDEVAATRLRQHYWVRYGATLQGLVKHHAIDPTHFLWETHQIPDLPNLLQYENGLAATLARLPGRKVIFSNGPGHYARAVVDAMGLSGHFDRLYSIESVGYRAKPDPYAFRQVLKRERVRPEQAVLIEDSIENIQAAKRLGLRTVWITRRRRPCRAADHVIASIRDLPALAASV